MVTSKCSAVDFVHRTMNFENVDLYNLDLDPKASVDLQLKENSLMIYRT